MHNSKKSRIFAASFEIRYTMNAILNPFIIKGEIPDAYFCDRIEETHLLTQHILNGRNVVMMSSRRVGKTGLIAHCFRQPELQDNYYTFFIDILETSSLREFTYALGREIFEKLKSHNRRMLDMFIQSIRSLNGEFGYDYMTGMPKFSVALGAIQNPEYTLNEIFEYINQADKRCIIAIDEFQQIVNYPEKNIEAILRKHIQHCQNADFIFAGSERRMLTEMFNQSSRPFYASTTEMNLNAIDIAKYTEFAVNCFREFGKDIPTEAVERVYRLFDGNTYCIQKTMNTVFSMVSKGECCTLETVRNAIDDIISEKERSYQNSLSLLTPKPKELLIAIAKEGKAQRITSGEFVKRHHLLSSSSVQSAVKQLIDGNWITYFSTDTTNRIYQLEDYFLMLWIQIRFGQGYQL